MTSLNDIETRAEAIIKDTNVDVLLEITGYVNTAQRELEDIYICPDQESDVTLRTGTGSPVFDGVHDFGVLFQRLGGAPFRVIYTQDDTITEQVTIRNLIKLSGDQSRFARRSTGDGERDVPRYYWMSGTTLSIYPFPDTNGEYFGAYTIRVPIWSRLAALSDAADTNWFCDNCTNFMIWRTAEQGLEFNRDPLAALYAVKTKQEKVRLKRLRTRDIFGHRFDVVPTDASALGSRTGSHITRRTFDPADYTKEVW